MNLICNKLINTCFGSSIGHMNSRSVLILRNANIVLLCVGVFFFCQKKKEFTYNYSLGAFKVLGSYWVQKIHTQMKLKLHCEFPRSSILMNKKFCEQIFCLFTNFFTNKLVNEQKIFYTKLFIHNVWLILCSPILAF